MAAPRQPFDARQAELETALSDIRRALWTVRSHVVLVAPPELCAAVCKELVADVGRPGRAIVLELAGRDAALAEQLVAKAIARTLSDDASESIPPQTPGAGEQATLRLAREGGSLVVLLPRADKVPTATLRRLGQLATSSQKALRLALCVDAEARLAGDAAGALVRALGVGAEKIVRGGPQQHAIDDAAEPAVDPAHAGPPRIEVESTGRRVAPVRVRSSRRSRRRWPVLALLGVAAIAWTLAGRPLPQALPFGLASALEASPVDPLPAPAPEPPAASSERSAELDEPETQASAIEEPANLERERKTERPVAVAATTTTDHESKTGSEPTHARAAEPIADAGPASPAPVAPITSARDTSPSAVAAAPSPLAEVASPVEAVAAAPEPATVAVSLNAQPWARIDVDDRDVGPTPIADLPLAPGEHRVRATFPSGRVVDHVLQVDDVHNHFRLD